MYNPAEMETIENGDKVAMYITIVIAIDGILDTLTDFAIESMEDKVIV